MPTFSFGSRRSDLWKRVNGPILLFWTGTFSPVLWTPSRTRRFSRPTAMAGGSLNANDRCGRLQSHFVLSPPLKGMWKDGDFILVLQRCGELVRQWLMAYRFNGVFLEGLFPTPT